MSENGPDLTTLKKAQVTLAQDITRTPVVRCPSLCEAVGGTTEVYAKLELMQRTGTFKARGALLTLKSLSDEERQAGVTAVSAGNHAIATAFAAKATGCSAKVVMIASANPARISACKDLGAEVVLAADVHEAFAVANEIQTAEGRYFVHPFEGRNVALGTGTLGLEICDQVAEFDALLVPVGGGGLIGGIANAVRQARPDCQIIGVEPDGADSMHRSFAAGRPASIDSVQTVADSLGAPYALPYSYNLTKRNVDALVKVSDDQIRASMGHLFKSMRLAVEPACAATTAALLGPLSASLRDKRVVLVFCGSNIDWATFQQQVIFDDLH